MKQTNVNELAVIMPVYNEASNVRSITLEILDNLEPGELLIIVEDGSDDGTIEIIEELKHTPLFNNNANVVYHEENKGYGEALLTGFKKALELKFPRAMTIDCDGQHRPGDIALFRNKPYDIISASRYLDLHEVGRSAPADRAKINMKFIDTLVDFARLELNETWALTDAFCGMKCYNTAFLCEFITFFENLAHPEEYSGYGFPLTLWGFYIEWLKQNNKSLEASFQEAPIDRIYTDEHRSFGEKLDNPLVRYKYYMKCFQAIHVARQKIDNGDRKILANCK